MRQKHNISEKAYAHFTTHIRSVFSLTGQGSARVERAIRALNEYIEGTRRDFDNLKGIPEVQLALMMLQPEIDRCLARSAAARARAKARKEQKKLQEQQADDSALIPAPTLRKLLKTIEYPIDVRTRRAASPNALRE